MKKLALIVLAAAVGIIVLVTTLLSFQQIDAQEVVVRLNNWTGDEVMIDTEGKVVVYPGFHNVYRFDGSPQSIEFSCPDGSPDRDGDGYPDCENDLENGRLTPMEVRASDGASFQFQTFIVQYEAIADLAPTICHEVGYDSPTTFERWMLGTTRRMVRDVFGQYSTLQVSNPANYGAMLDQLVAALNTRLNPHGIRVISVPTPVPVFNATYENVIEERNNIVSQRRVIEESLRTAETERTRALAVVDQTQNSAFQTLMANREGELASAEALRHQSVADARATLTEQEGAGLAMLRGAEQQAVQLQAQVDAEVAAFSAVIEAFEANGVEAVMNSLVDSLKGTVISIVPIRTDGMPETINVNSFQNADAATLTNTLTPSN